MSENNREASAPRYTVKHVDGVMHLSLTPAQAAKAPTGMLNPLPRVVERPEPVLQ